MSPVYEQITEVKAGDCSRYFVRGPYGVHSGRQEFFKCSYCDELSTYPLRVMFAGTDQYCPGYYRKRIGSGIFVLTMITDGDLRFVQDRREYVVQRNQLIVVRPQTTHEFEPGPAGYTCTLTVRIDGPILESLLQSSGLYGIDVVRPREPAPIKSIMNGIVSLIRDKQSDYLTITSVTAYELMVRLARCSNSTTYPQEIVRSLEYIHHSIARQISITALCEVAATGRSNLHRLFVKHLSAPPLQYVKTKKLEHAASELLSTESSVKRIAANAGFPDQLHFSREFRKHFGVSPSSYRGM